eukprot:TRINITY_DN55066_c0_g1_i1.p1 TRINITY_DN55066_c0_g1~~TRINITY_DN55066_c0_g1_i1.p1  ORF type:complete len:741 (+),score=223.82 TRINITY_DN55066_c0_g1_i1:187-2223(+)
MEDDHCVVLNERWGFFAVFDGHNGHACAQFLAKRIPEELKRHGLPGDDDRLTEIMLRLDREYLTQRPNLGGGSTATWAIVERPQEPGGAHRLRIGNVGDSRVLLGRWGDGSMIRGQGTDGALTTDHKPDLPSEEERIVRCGGRVEHIMGIARVNGDLAVSRAFGDAAHKCTGTPQKSDHPVSAMPQYTHYECDADCFLLLVCDGVSEGDFSNEQAVQHAAERLRAGDDEERAAAMVCRRALDLGSRDNISAMVVRFSGAGADTKVTRNFVPGPVTAPRDRGFRHAYTAMAERAGLTLAQALEQRYTQVVRELAELRQRREQAAAAEVGDADAHSGPGSPPCMDPREADLQREIAGIGRPAAEPGTPEYTQWFVDWVGSADTVTSPQRKPAAAADADALGSARPARHERRAPEHRELWLALDSHDSLAWDERMSAVAGKVGTVLQVDHVDNTSLLLFKSCSVGYQAQHIQCWLPNEVLQDVPGEEEEAEGGRDKHEASPAKRFRSEGPAAAGGAGAAAVPPEAAGAAAGGSRRPAQGHRVLLTPVPHRAAASPPPPGAAAAAAALPLPGGAPPAADGPPAGAPPGWGAAGPAPHPAGAAPAAGFPLDAPDSPEPAGAAPAAGGAAAFPPPLPPPAGEAGEASDGDAEMGDSDRISEDDSAEGGAPPQPGAGYGEGGLEI